MAFGEVSYWHIDGKESMAESKRVVFRPSSSTDTIRVGDLVCYNSDLAADWKEATTNRLTSDFNGENATTYAEGSQTYNARFLVVEKPATANLAAFAGVVKALGPKLGTDGDTIEIWVPKHGAVVPVMTDQSVTINSSVLGVVNAKYEASSGGVPIGIALETVDRSGTDGLTWMRFDNRLGGFAVNGSTALAMGTTASIPVNLSYNFAHVASYSAAMLVKAEQSGALASAGGTYAGLFYLNVSGSITASGYTRCVLAQLNLAGTINSSGSHQYAMMAQLTGTPTFTANQRCACLALDCNLGAAPTSGVYNALLIANNGANQTQVDHAIEIFGNYGINKLFSFQSCAGLTANFISNGGTGGATKVITSGGDWKKIKVDIDGTDYYLLAMVNPSEIDNT